MITQSNEKLKAKEFIKGGMVLRFEYSEKDITVEIPDNEETETKIVYEYEECLVSASPTREEIVSGIIRSKYSENDEISMINKGIIDNADDEFLEYQERRELAKLIADEYENGFKSLSWDDLRKYAGTLGISANGTREEIEAGIAKLVR